MQIPTSRQNTSIITFTKALFCSSKKYYRRRNNIKRKGSIDITYWTRYSCSASPLWIFHWHVFPFTPTVHSNLTIWPLLASFAARGSWARAEMIARLSAPPGSFEERVISACKLFKKRESYCDLSTEKNRTSCSLFFPLSNLIKFVMLPACWPVKLWSNVSAYRALICMIADDVTSPSSPRVFDSCALSFSFRLTTPSIFVLDWAATKACCMCAPFDAFSVLSWYRIRRLNHLVKTFGCVACLLWPYIQKYHQNVPVLNFSQLCPLLLPDKLACSAWACTCTTVATFV